MSTNPLPPTLPPAYLPEEYKRSDTALYMKWKETGDKAAMGQLIRQLSPIIYSEVRRTSGTLPESALSAEAKKWAVKAIQNFDHTKGVALSTHVMNYLPKVRRLNYKFQNAARLPENLQLQYTEFKNAVSHLETVLNREPTDEEIAKHIGWSKPLVVRFKGSLYEDLIESGSQKAHEATQFNENKFLMNHLLDQLDEQEKTILFNSKKMSSLELANSLGVSIPRLNYLKLKLRDKIGGIKTDIGMF